MYLLEKRPRSRTRPVACSRAYLTPLQLAPVGYTAAVNEPLPPDAIAVVTDDQLSTRLADEIVILGLRDSVYYGLSDVGARIWDLVQTRRTLGEIVSVLIEEYDVSREEAAAGLDRLIRELETRGLVAITLPDHA